MRNLGDIQNFQIKPKFSELTFFFDSKNDGLLSKLYFLGEHYQSGIEAIAGRNKYLSEVIEPAVQKHGRMGLSINDIPFLKQIFPREELGPLKRITDDGIRIIENCIRSIEEFIEEILSALNEKFPGESFSTYENFKRHLIPAEDLGPRLVPKDDQKK